MKQSTFAAFALTAVITASPALFAGPAGQAALQKEAKISMDQARAIALKKAPGKVESGELEREHGALIYSFDIRTSKGDVTEVNVSAIDGKIIALQHENAAKEAAEKKHEAKEKP